MQTEILKKLYLFRDLSPQELDKISNTCALKSYQPGEMIFQQGDPAHSLYVIMEGSVRILQKASSGDWVEVATLGPGSHFGEMPFLDGEPRSASAETTESCRILEFRYDKLQKVLDEHGSASNKFYRALAKFLCGRLRATTNDLSFAKEMNVRHF